MAELSVKYPISGYGYQWSSRLVNSKLGFATGWLLLIQFLTGFPGICKALGIVISDFSYQLFSFELNDVYISVFLIWVITFIHKKGIKIVSSINNLGVITEIIGVFLVIGLLIIFILSDIDNLSLNKKAVSN